MRINISIPIMLFLVVLYFSCTQERKIDNTKLQIRKDIAYEVNKENPFLGKVLSYYDNEKLKEETNYQEGKKHGLSISYYKNSQKMKITNYKNGMEFGLSTGWYTNGQKSEEGNYLSGEKDGLWSFWYTNGQIRSKGFYENGQVDSIWIYWDKNGIKKEEGNFNSDKKEGKWIVYHENEQKKEEGNYYDGKRVGIWKFWDENGNKKDIEYENRLVELTALKKSNKLFPERYGAVNDFADVISLQDEKRIESIINDTSIKTGIPIFASTIYSIVEEDLEDYAHRLNERWSKGKKSVLILIVIGDRKIRIQGDISIKSAREIIDNYFIPYLKKGEVGNACFMGVKAISEYLIKESQKTTFEN